MSPNVWRRAQSSRSAWLSSGPVSTSGGSPASQRDTLSVILPGRIQAAAAAGTRGCGLASSAAARSAASAGTQPSVAPRAPASLAVAHSASSSHAPSGEAT